MGRVTPKLKGLNLIFIPQAVIDQRRGRLGDRERGDRTEMGEGPKASWSLDHTSLLRSHPTSSL